MEIKRDAYLNKLIERQDNGSIKVVTGIRRCGKTYLLFGLFRNYLRESGVNDDHVIELALDDEENAEYRDPSKLYEYVLSRVHADDGNYYVLIDEIQYAVTRNEYRDPDHPPRLYGVLNGLLRKTNVDVYVTGSNSKLLSSDVRTEFRGRGDEIRVRPLSFSEYYPAHGGEKAQAWNDYFTYGGMPRVLSYPSDEGKAEYLNNLFSHVYLSDIIERNNLRGDTAIGDVVDVLASCVGSLTNPSNLAKTLHTAGNKTTGDKTIRLYIDYLKDSFLVEEAGRYDIKGRRYIGSPHKYYFTDLGLRNARLNFRQQEENHLMENAIYNELLVRGFNVDVGIVLHEERDDADKRRLKHREIDFVCNKGSKRYYVQSAFAIPDRVKMEQEQKSLVLVRDSFKKIIVVKDTVKPWHNDEGILVVGLIDFLLDPSLMDA